MNAQEYEFGGLKFRETEGIRQVQPDEFYLYGSPPKLGHVPATAEPSRGEFRVVVPSLPGGIRPTLVQSAEWMERTLRDNDWKGGWEGASHIKMQEKLWEEIREFEMAWYEYWKQPSEQRGVSLWRRDQVRKEGADVQNVVMMVVDLAGGYEHGDRVNGDDI